MSFHYPVVRAVLRKDLRLFWHFALLTGVMMAVFRIPPVVDLLGQMAGLVRLVLQFSSVLLILVVIYEDAVVSLKRDWLTRPIPGSALLAAKSVFIALALVVPSVVGGIAYELYQGHSVGEALLSGVMQGLGGDVVIALLLVMACAAVTASIRQAVVVVAGAVVAMALAQLATHLLMGSGAVSPTLTSSGWMVASAVQLTLLVAAALMLWVQYQHRRTQIARGIAGAAVVVTFGVLFFLTMPRVLAFQQTLSRDPDAEDMVQVLLPDACLPAKRLGADGGAVHGGEKLGPQLFPEEAVEHAGAGALAFATRLVQQPVPPGHRVIVDFTTLSYRAAGRQLGAPGRDRMLGQRAVTDDGREAADDYWLLPDAEYRRLVGVAGIETHLDYALSVLRAQGTASFIADGRRGYYPGVGYCSGSFQASQRRVLLDCFKAGDRPALMSAELEGAPQKPVLNGVIADYRPAFLDFWGGYRFTATLPVEGSQPPRVIVTTYQPRAHFSRQFVVPGVLGGPVSACPAP